MDIVFLGGEVPSHRKILTECGVKHIGVNYWRVVKRGLPKTKDHLLSDHFPEDVNVYVNAKINNENDLSTEEVLDFSADYEDWVALNDERIAYGMEFNSSTLGEDSLINERMKIGRAHV